VSLVTVVVAPHEIEPDALPRSARQAYNRLRAAGLPVRCWGGTAHESDRTHFGPDGEPDRLAEYVDKEPVPSEDGQPVLTPTGKQAMREVPTGIPVTYDWVSLHVGDPSRGFATWERDHRADQWKGRVGWVFGAAMPMLGVKAWEEAMLA
jgi:hypothetical protein